MSDKFNPTQKDLESADFLAIWEAIKHWDISTGDHGNGLASYTGATGNHVMMILDKLRPVLRDQKIDQIVDT